MFPCFFNYLNMRCTPILPLVYDDSLSYYEQICKLQKKVNEIVESINVLYQHDITISTTEPVDDNEVEMTLTVFTNSNKHLTFDDLALLLTKAEYNFNKLLPASGVVLSPTDIENGTNGGAIIGVYADQSIYVKCVQNGEMIAVELREATTFNDHVS